ncbi:MAG TPA: tol-pal system protein YbgF [Candidatus Hydrogenedens sp.]|nr:tol-pal system protein YbgF [Candidatus Hydrogenedens sp.]
MKILWRCVSFGLVIIYVCLSSSCGTTGGKQVETVIYDMHRRVTKLDKGFDGINTTFADLSVKLENNEQTMKSLQSVIEENQVKINQLGKDLNELKTTLYRHLNLSVSGTTSIPTTVGSTSKEVIGNVEILPPSSAQAPSIQTVPAPQSVTPTQPVQTPVPPQTTVPPPQPTTPPTSSTILPQPLTEVTTDQTSTVQEPKDDYMEAQRLFANGKYEEALARFNTHIKNYPTQETTPNAQFWKAKCLFNLDKFQEAIQEFEVLKNNYPNHAKVPIALQNEAVAYSRLGQNDKAIQLLKEVIEKYPSSPAADQARSDLEKLQKTPQ